MEYGDYYAKIAYILNGPGIFIVFLFGGFFNVITICILRWIRQDKDGSKDSQFPEELSITEKLDESSANYGSFLGSDNLDLISAKAKLSPYLMWMTCADHVLLTSSLLNYSIPTMFDLFSTYYAKFIPLW